MRFLRETRLSRAGALLLAAVSLVATVIVLADGSSPSVAQTAAEAALRHPPRSVEELAAAPAASTADSGNTGAAVNPSPPSGGSSSSSGSGGSSSTSSGGSSSGGSSATASTSTQSSGDSGSDDTPTTTTTTTTTTAPDAGLPKVGHVFLIALSTRDYASAFGARSQLTYLRSLARRGTLLSGYRSLGSNGLVDLLAMISGQAPNRDTAAGCRKYTPFPASATVTAKEITLGNGCVYPDGAITLADQVASAGKTWGAYIADMGSNNCSVPGTGAALDTPLDGTQEGYDPAHNPFAFFGSLLDEGGCSEYDQDLSGLSAALASTAKTPDFTYLAGDACVDADPTMAPAATGTSTSDASAPGTATGTTSTTSTTPARLIAPAAYGCPAGEPSGAAGENGFLSTWVPKILASPAYRSDGVLVIAFTGAGGAAHASTGALVLSRWTPRGRTIATSYTAYSLLHSVEDMLDLATLAHSATAPAFAASVLH